MSRVIERPSEMREASTRARLEGRIISFVPTMGFLHDGHRELLRRGRAAGDLLVMSIFVNPAQFGPREDLASYPRDFERDLRMAEAEGVDIVFAPSAAEMYPEGYQTWVEVEGLSKGLCGAMRPGHFRGVATVVLKLFNVVQPHRALFGRKDLQQLKVIERMVRDLDVGVEVVGVDTVREPDGLAMSSRNSYLSPVEREAARCVPRAIEAARGAAAGTDDCALVVEKAKKIIEKEPLAVVDYIRVCHAGTLEDALVVTGDAVLFLAVRIGKARLIDNATLR